MTFHSMYTKESLFILLAYMTSVKVPYNTCILLVTLCYVECS